MARRGEPPFAPPPDGEEPAADDDYIFRFRLDPSTVDPKGHDDALLELIRGQLADLLDAVQLTYRGQLAKVDGFRLLQDPDTQYEVFPRRSQDPAST